MKEQTKWEQIAQEAARIFAQKEEIRYVLSYNAPRNSLLSTIIFNNLQKKEVAKK